MTWENDNLKLVSLYLTRKEYMVSYYLVITSIWCQVFVYVHVCEWKGDQLEWVPGRNKWTEVSLKFPSYHTPPSLSYFPTLFTHAVSHSLWRMKNGFTLSFIVSFLYHHFHYRLLIGCHLKLTTPCFLSLLGLFPEFVPGGGYSEAATSSAYGLIIQLIPSVNAVNWLKQHC